MDCTICTKASATDSYACLPCLDAILYTLDEVVEQYGRLDVMPGGPSMDGTRRSPGFRSTSPANDHVIALTDRRTKARNPGDIQNAHTVLWEWVEFVRRERGWEPLSSSLSLEGCRGVLAVNLDWIGRQEWVSELATHLHEILAQLRSANGIHRPRPLGRCFAPREDGDLCWQLLWPPTEGAVVACPDCGATYDALAILKMEVA